MLRFAGWLWFVVIVVAVGCGPAEVKVPDAQPPEGKPEVNAAEVKTTASGLEKTAAEEQVSADPNNMEAWQELANERFGAIRALEPKEALAGLDAFAAFVKKHPGTEPEAQEVLDRLAGFIDELRLQVEASAGTMPEFAKDLNSNPDDLRRLARYALRLRMETGPLIYKEPDKAGEIVAAAKIVMTQAQEKASESFKAKYDTALLGLKNQEAEVEKGRKLLAMRGEPAGPLAVAAWVSGSGPLNDADLKGKVVLLDFWAIWCPPCIEELPQIEKWHKQYADKGLVVIGVTQYFNFKWDEKKGAPVQVNPDEEMVPHPEEAAVVSKFVKKHELTYRIAIDDEQQMTKFYLATGLPHLVLIDQQGKIVFTGPGGSEEVDARLKELLGP